MKPLVIYHHNCPDGFTAAWIANKYLRDAELRPMDYTDEPPTDDEVRDREVYVVDFSFKRLVCDRDGRGGARGSAVRDLRHGAQWSRHDVGLFHAIE